MLGFGVVHFGVLRSYQQARLVSFVDTPINPISSSCRPQAGANEYNLAEAKITIGDGGVTGQGIGHGTQTNLSYVPEQRTDFIFTAVGEQVGLIGSAPAARLVPPGDLADLASRRPVAAIWSGP